MGLDRMFGAKVQSVFPGMTGCRRAYRYLKRWHNVRSVTFSSHHEFIARPARMPELPEVETSRRGIAPWLEGMRVRNVTVRERRLRWPVPKDIDRLLPGEIIHSIRRRAKYLLFHTDAGTMLLHLGMSGSVRIIADNEPAAKHDHVDIGIEGGKALRFRDPRRFGSILWAKNAADHPLLRDLGPEPLGLDFSGEYLWRMSRGRRISIKQFIMNASIVVGVGNIYASESLFMACVHPRRRADRVSLQRMRVLANCIVTVLEQAITAGGTTLRDFYGGDGEPGYFRPRLEAYGREGEPCRRCNEPISAIVLGQRSTFYCKRCQR
jgi:formamidopyrimidine-DNA glycosylase